VLTNPAGRVLIPNNEEFLCENLVFLSESGQWSESKCAFLEPFVQEPCGCEAVSGNIPVSPTASPESTSSPGETRPFPPAPECFEDLNSIQERENSLSMEEVKVGRTYTLCPNREYFIGRLDPSIPGTFVGGSTSFLPRPNVYYKCGTSGSSTNNCRIIDGSFPIVMFGSKNDLYSTNVTFQGITIESSFSGGVLAAKPGDVTFIDCIFRNHENLGPIILLYENRLSRRLAQLDFHEFMNEWETNTLVAPSSDATNEEPTPELISRTLQTSALISTFTFTCRKCLFEGNRVSSRVNAFPGIINAQSSDVEIVLEDVVFRNNDYRTPVKAATYAIASQGPLTLRNSCFEDNDFIGDAPIVVFGGAEIDLRNNFLSSIDDELLCPFVVTFEDDLARQMAKETMSRFTCTSADAEECAAELEPTRTPRPTPLPLQPTRRPVTRATIPPSTGLISDSNRLSLSPLIHAAAFLVFFLLA